MKIFDDIEAANAFAAQSPVVLIIVNDDNVVVCETPDEVPESLRLQSSPVEVVD